MKGQKERGETPCTDGGAYLMSSMRIELLNNGLLSMTTPEEGPHPRDAVRSRRACRRQSQPTNPHHRDSRLELSAITMKMMVQSVVARHDGYRGRRHEGAVTTNS